MEEKRAKFVSRGIKSPSSTASGGSAVDRRLQWRGMDLHTSAPSTHRAAIQNKPRGGGMFVNASPPQQSQQPQQQLPATPYTPTRVYPAASSSSATLVAPSAIGRATARMKAEDAALSARNLVLRRRLSERKRFDSADYAMKQVMHVMHVPDSADTSPVSPPPATTPPPSSSASTVASSPRDGGNTAPLSRVSAQLGASVFAHALHTSRHNDSADDDNDSDVEMKDEGDDHNNQQEADPVGYTRTLMATAKPTPRFGQLGMTPSAAMSAANYLIQRKLHEKRHFDSADYQLALQGKPTDAAMDGMGAPALSPNALEINNRTTTRTSTMSLNPALLTTTTASPVNSPSSLHAASTRYAHMSPAVQPSAGAGKHGTLGMSRGGMAGSVVTKPQRSDLRRGVLLRQQDAYIASQEPAPAVAAPPPAPAKYGLLAAGNTAATTSKGSKFGKLCAANVLLRRDLKERKFFDSADYEMECAAKQARPDANETTADQSFSPDASNQNSEPSSPVMHPLTKHIKLSGTSQRPNNVWSTSPATAPPAQDVRVKVHSQHPEARLAARNVALHNLSDRKLFDSGDHFAAAEAIRRRREGAHGHHHV